MAEGEKTAPDWERIEVDYRAGVLSLREIAAANGITHGAINKRAKRDGWCRDLKAKIQAKADELVSKQAVSTAVSTAKAVSERQIIEANAERIAQVRGEHRGDIQRVRTLALTLLGELEGQSASLEDLANLGELLRNPDEDGNPPAAIERLVVVATVDTPSVDWGPIGNAAREEVWRFPIFVETAIPGMTSDEASLRLEELTSLIEANVHSIQAGARTGTDQPAEWFQYPKWSVAVERVKPMCPIGPDGYIGRAEVVIGCKFRINTPPRTE